jgi:hypothetical protein
MLVFQGVLLCQTELLIDGVQSWLHIVVLNCIILRVVVQKKCLGLLCQ